MQVVEPPLRNDSLHVITTQTLIRRHRFEKPKTYGEPYYTLDDLDIGTTLDIYGHDYTITNVDLFTRKFLTKMGYRVKDPIPEPQDPYTQQRIEMEDRFIPRKPYEKFDTLGQFLQFNGKVLRFMCHWDDRKNMFGDERHLILHYYLDDDTIELIEILPPNSGRDHSSTFLHRRKLPKCVEPLPHLGEMTQRTLLNISGVEERERKYILDNNPLAARKITYYKDSDLYVGAVIDAWGRKLFLHSCDDFTKEFYRKKYGLEMVKIPLPQDTTEIVHHALPSHDADNEEEIPRNCSLVIPKPPEKDLLQFLQKDKFGLESKKLRFISNIITDNEINRNRRFIISFYLADDTIQIYEVHQPNSGIDSDKLKRMVRCRMKKPGTPANFAWDPFRYYLAHDMYVGAVLYLRGHNYILQNADDYTFQYMEENSYEFPYADIKLIMGKMRSWLLDKANDVKGKLEKMDPDRKEYIQYIDFRKILLDVIPDKIVEHEIMTVGRYYAEEDDYRQPLEYLTSLAQTELRKKNFHNFENLELAVKHYDSNRSGEMTPLRLYITLRAYPLPIHSDLLRKFIKKLKPSSEGMLNYMDVLQLLDWQKNPLAMHEPTHYKVDEEWTGTEIVKTVERISYKPFLEDIVYGLGHNSKLDSNNQEL